MKGEEQRVRLLEVIEQAELGIDEVWICYLGMGGDVAEYEVTAYLYGLIHLPDLDQDLIFLAVDELYEEVWGKL